MFLFHCLGRMFHGFVRRRGTWWLGSSLVALVMAAGHRYYWPAGNSARAIRLSDPALASSPALAPTAAVPSGLAPAAKSRQSLARLPLSFEANQGQTDKEVDYLSRGPGYTVFLTPTEAVLTLSPAQLAADSSEEKGTFGLLAPKPEATAVRIQLIGANPAGHATGGNRLPGNVNYFRGNDPSRWQTRIPTYAEVQYHDVYPGIGLLYYGNQQQLEYDFQVAPGADPSQIRLAFAGAQSIRVDARGDLVMQAGGQTLRQHQPVAYQEIAGRRWNVPADFVVQGEQISFALGEYDSSQPLVIDPVLGYSSYFGGSGSDTGVGIAVDAAGYTYVTGTTNSTDFPTTNALQPTYAAGNMSGFVPANAFIAKFTPDGSGLVYSTYLGGSVRDAAVGIGVDAAGNAYITGITYSPDFPIVNAFQPDPRSTFVSKLSADGSVLVYSTYLGGSDSELAGGIAVDADGNAYVTGETYSHDFPTSNALQPTFGGGFVDTYVTKFTPDGSSLAYSTFLGGSGDDRGYGIAVDPAGNAYVTGFTRSPNFPTVNPIQSRLRSLEGNAFVAKLTADGSALVYSTFLGGSGSGDLGYDIAADVAGNAYVTGYTGSRDFPTMNAFQPTYGGNSNAFVAKLAPDGSALVYSTYLGGSGGDFGFGIGVDAVGNAYVTGFTNSPDFPTINPLQATYGGNGDAFVTELTADGSTLGYSTYLGGSGSEDNGLRYGGIAVDAAGNAYVTGSTTSPDFPTTNPLQPQLGGSGATNAFVAKISPVVLPGPATQVQISAPAQVTSGTPFDITITAQDANGLTAVGYQGTVTFSATDTDPGVALPASYTFTAADQGVHTFTADCTLITAGNQAVTVTDTADATITGTATITVNPGP
jgi:hypothetical protein